VGFALYYINAEDSLGKFTNEELREMVKPGFIFGKILS
jgi:hypothetical protein